MNTTRQAVDPPSAKLRELVAIKLGRDPVDYARERRASTTPPMSWNRIADELKAATDIYITHEAVRRWVRNDDRRLADEQREAA